MISASRHRIAVPLLVAIAVAIAPSPASASFGIADFDAGVSASQSGGPYTQAGGHPYDVHGALLINGTTDTLGNPIPDGSLKDVVADLPPGLIGNPQVVPQCSEAELVLDNCDGDTQVGVADLFAGDGSKLDDLPVYSMVPAFGQPAEFGFTIEGLVVVHPYASLRSESDYGITFNNDNITQWMPLRGGTVTIWGVPGDPAHDSQRTCHPVKASGCASSIVPPKPFLTMPTSCTGPPTWAIRTDSWQEPGNFVTASILNHDNFGNPIGMTGCDALTFSPLVSAAASTDQAETSSGFDFGLGFEDKGLITAGGLAQSQVRRAVVTLPQGVTINPSVGEGLGVCSPADLKRETVTSVAGAGCPNSSKIGTVHLETPLLEEAVEGSVYLAQQDDAATTEPGAENPFDTLIAFYIVLRNAERGVIVKLPAKVEPDPKTGQLITTVDNAPQVPFSKFNFHFREGQRAPLVSPPTCGTYTTEARLYPWSDPDNPRIVNSSFKVTQGVSGGPCPSGGIPPFHPDFKAGAVNNSAGSFSPFNMRLLRSDGEQDMTKFSSILPPGELGSLAGVGKCPDSALDAAKSKTGRQEIASPSCPANSLIGHTLAGAGVGGALTYVGGQIYLGGPYHGDPLSVISVTPAVAGPFDAGTVVVRLALTLNPKTAEVEVDGANSDPIPHILKGIVLKLRDLRVYVDRPNFTLNPTNCDESRARARLFGSYLNVFDPADDVPVDLSSRYQAADCASLGFKPKLSLKLKGGTKRGGHPGLLANYQPRSGDANVKGLVVRLPRSAFLDQAHIRTICTRVQFAADTCPPGAQYGFIKAWTPLLDTPLEGPVYLRSSDHKLPDLVFDLHGLVDIEVSTRIDSARGGIRATLEDLPDAPLSKVVLQMQGGKKGLIVNSRNLCGVKSKADVGFTGQNGKQASLHPVMQADCGKRKQKRASH